MPSISKILIGRLHSKRRALLRRYDHEALHQLRVALRRLRSLLRHHDSGQAHQLRQDLGQLAATTNAARDWDTLVIRARESLRPRQFRLVQPWLEEGRAASHRLVIEMLNSTQWTEAMAGLEEFVEKSGAMSPGGIPVGADITRTKREVYHAWCKVRSDDDSKHWHKLRLAIKELRYSLGTVPQDALEPALAKTLKHCKRLQENLGVWHDTVVHLRMVREFSDSLDPEADSATFKVLKGWRKELEREARDYLDTAQSYLEGKGSDLLQ